MGRQRWDIEGSGKKRKDTGGKRAKRDFRMIFWNVAGLRSNDGEFWNGDVITLLKTWIEEKKWNRIKERLPGDLQEGRLRWEK